MQGGDVSKGAFTGFRDPNDSRAPCLFVAAPLPLGDSVSLLERVCELPALTSPVRPPNPPPAYPGRTCSQPSPTNTVPLTHPHVAHTARGAGGGSAWAHPAGSAPLLPSPGNRCVPEPRRLCGLRCLPLAGSLSPAPFPLQPPQKYIVFSPNPVQLQHNKTHNKNLIHFSPAPISRHLLARD